MIYSHRNRKDYLSLSQTFLPHLLIYVRVTGVNAVSEKVFSAAITAAQVAALEQLPTQTHRRRKVMESA